MPQLWHICSYKQEVVFAIRIFWLPTAGGRPRRKDMEDRRKGAFSTQYPRSHLRSATASVAGLAFHCERRGLCGDEGVSDP